MKPQSTRTIAALAALLAAVVAIVLWKSTGSPAPSTEIAAPPEVARAQESTELSRATSHEEPPPPSAEIVSPQPASEERVEHRTPPAKTPQIRVIVEVIDHPVAEVFTNPHLAGITRRYFEDVGAFEKSLRG